MKSKLILAVSAALALSCGLAVAQSTDGTYQQQKTTTTTTTTTNHIDGAHEVWYKEGGVVPEKFRAPDYVLTDWQSVKLTQPTAGNEWVRGANGDYLLVNQSTGEISSIVHAGN